MGLFSSGRPKKLKYDEINKLPKVPGEYRIRDTLGKMAYIGETNNLNRRAKEHKKVGKFKLGFTIEYLVAKTSTSAERRIHEQNAIKKYQPYLNKSRGGEGRPEKISAFLMKNVSAGQSFNAPVMTENKPLKLIRKVFKFIGMLVKLLFKIMIIILIGLIVITFIGYIMQ